MVQNPANQLKLVVYPTLFTSFFFCILSVVGGISEPSKILLNVFKFIISGQIIYYLFHQPIDFPEIREFLETSDTFWGENSCEVAS